MLPPLDALIRHAAERPDAVAIVFGDRSWTYAQLWRDVRRLAAGLKARGIKRGDRVALHMTNVPELAMAYYACFALGAVAAPIGTRLKPAELVPLLQRLRPRLYLGQAALYRNTWGVPEEVLPMRARFLVDGASDTGAVQPWARLLDRGADVSPRDRGAMDAPAVLLGTSGATGRPKFAAHTARSITAAAAGFVHIGLDDQQSPVNCLPMVHAGGFFTLMAYLSHGARMILIERFDAERVLDAVAEHRGTWLIGLPFMFGELLAAQQRQARDVDSLQLCLSGGDICPPDLQRVFGVVFDRPLRSFWGAAEAMGGATFGLQPGPVFRLLPAMRWRLVDADGDDVADGRTGELLLQGPPVTPGYWQDVDEIAPVGEDGWYATGDLVRRGAGDDFWFVARAADAQVGTRRVAGERR